MLKQARSPLLWEARSPKKNNMKKSNYEVDILVNGKPLKEYYHDKKNYIEGKRNTEFSLRIKNNGSTRISAVPSVDGLSVMDGKKASFNSSGYIIDGYDSMTIDGWRISDSEVAKFYFSNSEDSYGKRKGEGDNLGIIGLVIFEEKHNINNDIKDLFDKFEQKPCIPYVPPICPYPKRWPYHDREIWCSNHSSPLYETSSQIMNLSSNATGGGKAMISASSSSVSHSNPQNEVTRGVSQEIGTGWGEAKKSEVTTVNFEREKNSSVVFEIYYNTRKQLEKIGIDFTKKPVYVTPQAFPGQYCEPPQN